MYLAFYKAVRWDQPSKILEKYIAARPAEFSILAVVALGGIPFFIYYFSRPREFKSKIPLYQKYIIPRTVVTAMRTLFATVVDAVLLPAAGVTTLLAKAGLMKNENGANPSQHKVPILLVHGGNEGEWALGRHHLKDDNYGAVFSGVDSPYKNQKEYRDLIAKKIVDICKKTNNNEIILIGAGSGGLAASDVAETPLQYVDEQGNNHVIAVKHVITIDTPFKGSPYANLFRKAKAGREFSVQVSENHIGRKYYNIASDVFMRGDTALVTKDPARKRRITYLGPIAIRALPPAWLQVRKWLNEIYAPQ